MFQRFFDEGLAQASFLIGCDRTRQAVVIDPRRDAAIYAAAAAQLGATIVAAIETHVHADFVSGARELAALGARVITGPDSGVKFAHHEAQDGERFSLGDVTLTFLHTPGHTPEHISVLAQASGQPGRLFTGDLLFVGAVGRPDLLGAEQTAALARDLFGSLQRVMALDAAIEVHPGHGAGSLCGAGIGKEPSSTIGRERRQNALLHHTERAPFVAAVLADIPPTPPYFARMKRVNADGPALLASVRGAGPLPAIQPAAAAALAADGATIIDLRDAAEFGAGHPAGALNIGFGSKVGYWAGWVVSPDEPVLLLCDTPAHAAEAAMQLLRVGLDRVEGTIAGGYHGWLRAGLPVGTIDLRPITELHDVGDRAAVQLLDVRTPGEWASGHVDGSINIPVGEIVERASELRRDAVTAVMCEAGYRSALAASLLEQEGFTRVVNLTGGMAAYRESGNRVIGESGNRGIGESGNPGIRESGNRGIGESEAAMKPPTLNEDVRSRLDAVIGSERPDRVPELVKAVLVDSMQCGSLAVPDKFRKPIEGTYARRLLHRDPAGQYTMVVMTWGPGQKTALHDHAGIWCVECVVDGQMEVAQYDLQSEHDGRYRFAERSRVMAGRGSAGCLIPPFEYHTLGNAAGTPSITLHVYGGEMDHCHVFEPAEDGSYRRVRKDLAYHT